MRYILALHIIGIVMWLGGMMITTRLFKIFRSSSAGADSQWPNALMKLWRGFILPGALIVIVSGILQVLTNGVGYYMQQGWFHAKLTFVVLLVIATAFLGSEIKSYKEGNLEAGKNAMLLHGIAGLALLANVFLTMLGR